MHSDESADILGGRIQVSPPRPPFWSDPGRMTLLLGFVTVAAIAWVRIAPHYRQWRETRYRKAMRRRHGIPDDDHRPFNVAYAAALQARKKREGRGSTTRQAPQEAPMEDGQHFPPRPSDTVTPAAFLSSPAGTSTGYQNGYASTSLNPGHDSYDLPASRSLQSGAPQAPVRSTGSGSNGGAHVAATRNVRGKHALDDEMDVGSETLAKKSRVEGEKVVNMAEAPEWQDPRMDAEQHVGPTKRGSKRVASLEDDEGLAFIRAERRDKRARKVSIDNSADTSEDGMDEDDLDGDLEDFPSNVRGKKRDRAEAGSTFGGEDSFMDEDEKPERQRRRRIVSNKLSQSLSRGQKRVRDLDSHDSDDSEAERPTRESMRKKRGKRSDEDAIPVSNDPLCKGRRIGEEWEANGVRYKVGPNGQRLRQELVKKSRSRFPMPSDSQHPDRRANVDVYVETWLTEEEYQAAKERHELAWQDAPPSPEPQTPTSVPDSPSKAGKNLLWSSTMASRESPAKRGSLRQSITGNPLRLSVLAPSPVTSSRRISTVYQVPASPASDSPKLQKSKSYSKWEKQDLEAAAMSKIREKQQQQAKVTSAPAATTAPATTSTSFGAAPSAPTATAKKPELTPQPTVPSFSFAPPSTSAQPSKPTAEMPKLSVPSSNPATAPSGSTKPAAPLFPFPSSSAPSSTPASAAPPATTPATTTAPSATNKSDTQASGSVPNFFAKPPATAPAAPSASSGSVPNFFAKPAEQATAPSANSTSTTPATSQASTAPKPTFSFAPAPTTAQQQTNAAPATNGTAKPDEAKPIPGGSLLSRLGMGPPPVAASPATFSFAKPGSSASNATNGTPSDAAKSAPTAPASGAAAPEPPKFSFGAPSKPANSAPATNGATSAAPSSATSAGPGTSTPKFSFGVNNASSQPAGSSASTSSAVNSFQNSSATNAANPPAAKSAFSFGGSNTSTSSPFGGNSNTSNSSPFGAASSAAPAANNASPFGAATGTTSSTSSASPFGTANGSTKPAEAPKSAFSFGNPAPAASNTSASAPAEGPKSAFSFGAPTAPASNASAPAEAPKPAFSFGNTSAPSSSTSIFGGASGAQSSSTPKPDAPATKSAFSLGFSSSTPAFGSSSTPAFGTSSTPAFGASSTASPFGSTTSASAFGSSSTAPTFGASSSAPAFGSGSSSGTNSTSKPTFSFGAPAGNNGGSSTTPATGATENKTENKPFGGFGFGASNTNGSNNTSTPAASSPFGFGAQPSSNNASTPAASSPFGNAQQGFGSSGFGAPSGSFSFGSSSNAGQNTQK
ncbi:hypothetical protein C8Q73DRAFT_836395 [Cubamyces lactineus]|nr:hypothetical protein C8Q73DRAFT_836395 [Cubamyces lactineus]